MFCQNDLSTSSSIGSSKADSLIVLLNSHQKLDSIKVDLQNQLGYEYWIIDPNQSEVYGTQAIELSRILNYQQGYAWNNAFLTAVVYFLLHLSSFSVEIQNVS